MVWPWLQSARNQLNVCVDITMTKWVGLATVAIILPSIASSFHYTSSFILHSNRWVVVHQNKRKTTLAGQPPDKGDLYNDDELFELLNLHQALNPNENEEKKGLFSDDGFDNDEEEEDLFDAALAVLRTMAFMVPTEKGLGYQIR